MPLHAPGIGYTGPARLLRDCLQKVWQEQQSHNELALVPASAIRAVLRLLQGSGFVRLDRHGFVVTDLGGKLYEQIERVSKVRALSAKRSFEFMCNEVRGQLATERSNNPTQKE